jgi:glycosyltransferase involved in cell wall biosynthesis
LSAVRVLLDYRPALRQRTGVGEYIHELARALVASAAHGEELYLFSSSWKDRLAPNAVPGAETVDRRIPVRVLNLAWHRLGWPRVEQVTGRQYDIVQSAHPLLIPARAGARVVTIADLDFLDHPERARAEIKRDYGPLAAAHAARADRVIVISRDTASAVEQRLGVPASKISICYPGAPGWARRDQEPFARTACVLFLGTLEPRKNLGVLLDAYERLLTHQRDVPPLVLAGRLGADAGGILSRATRPPLAGHVEIPGYIPTTSEKRSTVARWCSSYLRTWKGSECRRSKRSGSGCRSWQRGEVHCRKLSAKRAASSIQTTRRRWPRC